LWGGRAAEEISLAFGLDRIIFVPAARPPHKEEGRVASALHRYEMVSLATVFTPYFTVSPIELKRPGRSYSVETVREFRRIYGPETRLYFILGVDAFLEIGTWKEARELLRLARLIVTARPGWRLDEVERSLTPARRRLLGDPQFKYLRVGETDAEALEREFRPGLVLLVEVVSLDISSSEIRRLVEQGRSIRFLVPDTVAAYMAKNRLYQAPRRGRRRDPGARAPTPAAGVKPKHLVILDLRGICSFADHFLIVSGDTDRQVRAIADRITERLEAAKVRTRHREGYPHGQWILLDYQDVIVHIFTESLRRYYDLERLWADAPRREVVG